MPGLTHAVFEVDDLDEAYQRLIALGTEVLLSRWRLAPILGRAESPFTAPLTVLSLR